jgi:hypothetical protein
MVAGQNPLHLHFSPVQHARVSLVLAVVLFLLAAVSYSWNEGVHYRLYLILGLIFAFLGFVPLVIHALQPKSK